MTIRSALGLDLGTSGLKAVLVGEDGAVLAQASRPYVVASSRPGWAETDPRLWEEAARDAVLAVVAQVPGAEVVGVGLDGQMHGTVLVNDAGKAVRPAILWPDARAVPQMPHWLALKESQRLALANPLTPGMPGPVLGWLAEHEPEVMTTARTYLSPKDWLRSRLVPGSWVSDPSDASATLLWNVGLDDWDRELCTQVGVDPDLLPDIAASDAIAGTLDAATALAWGLPVGVPVSTGCADVAGTILGTPARPGRYTVTVGTGAQIILPSIVPSVDGPIRHHTYRAADTTYYAMAAVMNAGLALSHVVGLLGASWDDLYRPYDPERALPGFLPFVAGERLPVTVPASSAGWFDVGLGTRREDLFAAAIEGVAFAIRRALDLMPSADDEVIDLAGGGSRSPVFAQLLADVLGRPLRQLERGDATALGAARLGWAVSGAHQPPHVEVDVEPIVPRPVASLEERYARFIAQAGLAGDPR